jgi:hypothetical protein
MALFAKAKARSKETVKKSKKETVWTLDSGEEDKKVSESITKFRETSAQIAELDAKKKLHASIITRVVKDLHVRSFCERGVPPEGPMVLRTPNGEQVNFVVQDRGGQYPLSDDTIEMFRQLIGDAIDGILYTETKISFDRATMAIPGVSEAIEKALESAIKKLINNETLTAEQADELIVAEQKTAFKPGTLERSAEICGRDPEMLTQFLDIMDSSCTRYIK